MQIKSERANQLRLNNDIMHMHVELQNGVVYYDLQSVTPGLDIRAGVIGDMTCDDQRVVWQSLHHHSPQQRDDGSTYIELTLRSQTLLLTHTIQLYSNRPFVRMFGQAQNISTQNVTVTNCAILHLGIAQAPLYLFHVDQFSWAYRRDFFTQHQSQIWPGRIPIEIRMGSYPSHYDGATSCAWFALRPPPHDRDPEQPHQGDGLVAGIEFDGKSRILASATATQTSVISHIDALNHRLAPQQLFEVPGHFVGRYHGDWDEAGFVTQRFAEQYIHPPRPDDRYPWVQYNSWKYGQEINEAQQLQVIDACHDLGIEVFVIDLGWARCIGDWRPDPVKFPRGLAPLAARAKQYGMRFGVHVALAQCAPQAPIATEHPEWLIHSYDDYFGAGILCFGNDPCRAWIIAQLSRLIEEEKIDYIIQDGEDMVKYCPRHDHTHAPNDSNYANSQLGIDKVISHIRTHYPHVVIENCEDGGMMMTYKMAQMYHTSITVDNIATYATRQGVYGASYPFSPRYSVRYMEDQLNPYTLRSSIFGGPLIFMQRVTDWNAQEKADARAAILEYKRFRTLIRDAKVVHLLPPRANVDNVGVGWDAIQAVSLDQQESVIMVYRAKGDADERCIRPRALAPDVLYHVSLQDHASTLQLRGAQLMEQGVTLTLAEFSSEIIVVTRVQGA